VSYPLTYGDMLRNLSIIDGISRTTAATSSSVVYRLRLNRVELCAIVYGTPMARMTCEGSSDPVVHAEPDDAAMPFSSSISRMASPSMNSKLMLVVLGRRSVGWPFRLAPVQRARSSRSSVSRSVRTRVFSSSMFAITVVLPV